MSFRSLRIRLFNWEYWPFTLVYLPVFVYWLWLSIRARSLLYFTASNPSIRNGGMMGESKMDILNLLPADKVPKTLKITAELSAQDMLEMMNSHRLRFPLIAKPDIGERGTAVRKINTREELLKYRSEARFDFLLQEYVDLPLEAGVFYYRIPGQKRGRISSVTLKEMLFITGDGNHTIGELAEARDRAYLQLSRLKNDWAEQWHHIPEAGDKIILQGIGNHCKGTKFLNGNHLITEKMERTFDGLADSVPGFHFGRFDLRTSGPESLEKGDFLIMELNGAGAEPSHIYDPMVSISEAYSTLLFHWKTLFRISLDNHKSGIPYLSLREGLREYRKVMENQRLTEQF